MRITALLLICSLMLVQCQTPQPGQQPATAPLTEFHPAYARGFSWKQYPDHYEVVLLHPGQEGDTLGVVNVPAGGFSRMACVSTTHVAFLEKLNALDRLLASGYAERLLSPDVLKRFESGMLTTLHGSMDQDREILMALHPDVLFTYPFGGDPMSDLRSAGVQTIPVSEYLESHPLARAEWIRLFGVFAGKAAEGDALFRAIEDRYQTIRGTQIIEKTPVIFFGSHEGENWFAASGASFISMLIHDAGGHYIFDTISDRSNIPLSREEVIQLGSECTLWGEIMYQPFAEDEKVIQSIRTSVPSLASNGNVRIFMVNAAERDYFGRALLEPDVLLSELQSIFSGKKTKGAYFVSE